MKTATCIQWLCHSSETGGVSPPRIPDCLLEGLYIEGCPLSMAVLRFELGQRLRALNLEGLLRGRFKGEIGKHNVA